MSDVIFNEEDQGSVTSRRFATDSNSAQGGAVVKLAMKMGAKSERSANLILLAVAILAIILTIIVYFVFIK